VIDDTLLGATLTGVGHEACSLGDRGYDGNDERYGGKTNLCSTPADLRCIFSLGVDERGTLSFTARFATQGLKKGTCIHVLTARRSRKKSEQGFPEQQGGESGISGAG